MTEWTAAQSLLPIGSNLVFISHSHDDKEVALELKGTLRILGFQGFVAHEDIEPTREWENEILGALKRCTALIAVASPSGRASAWMNQEIGAVVIRQRPVLAVKHGCAPWAMLYRYQSIPWERVPQGRYGKSPARELLEANIPRLIGALGQVSLITSHHLVEGLGETRSFEEARVIAQQISGIGRLGPEEAARMVYLAASNPNITGCWEAQRLLPPLLKPYRESIPGTIIEALQATKFRV